MLQNYFVCFKMSLMQHRQYQTVMCQFWTFFALFSYPYLWGMIWVRNFVLKRLFYVFSRSLK
jgi:hypothetical protein